MQDIYGVEKRIAQDYSLNERYVDQALKNDDFFALLRGEISEEEYFKKVILQEKWDISVEYLKEITRENFHKCIEGTIHILEELKEKNYSLYLLSDHVKEWMDYIYKIYDFFPLFHKIYFSYELGHLKKEGISFKMVLEDLQLSPKEVLFIDDSIHNIETAKKFGIDGIVFKNAEQLKQELIRRNIL